jgi:molybdate transport system ATP-binding protein
VRAADGMVTDSGARIVSTVATDAARGERVAAAIRPTAVRVSVEPAVAPGANRFVAAILDLEPRGDIVRVRSELISADLHPAAVADAGLTTGMTVQYVFDADAVTIYGTHTEQAQPEV